MPVRQVLDVEVGGNWEAYFKAAHQNADDAKQATEAFQKLSKLFGSGSALHSETVGRDWLGRKTSWFGYALPGETWKMWKGIFHDAEQSAAHIAKNFKATAESAERVTGHLLKWGALTGAVGGLIGLGGGLFGLDRLAGYGWNLRRSSLGLGVLPSEQEAFGTAYGRLVNAPGVLANVSEAQQDLANWQFSALGINPRGKDAAQIGREIVQRAHDLWAHGDRSVQSMHAYGLDRFLTIEEWRRVGTTPQRELGEIAARYNRVGGTLAGLLSPADLKRWQDLQDQLTGAGKQIEAVFIKGLVPLSEPLQHLSKAFGDLVEKFMGAAAKNGWVDEIASAMEHLASYIGSDTFKTDVEHFTAWVGQLAHAVGDALRALGVIPSDDKAKAALATDSGFAAGMARIGGHLGVGPLAGYGGKGVNYGTAFGPYGNSLGPPGIGMTGGVPDPDYLYQGKGTASAAELMKYFEGKGWSKAQAAGIVANLFAESGFHPNISGDNGQAYGLGQWHPDRQAMFAKLFGHDIHGSSWQEQAEFYNWELDHTEAAAGRRLRAARAAAEAAAIVSTYDERPRDTAKQAAYRGRIAQGIVGDATSVRIRIDNNTGGSAIVSSSQLAQ